MVEKAVNRHVMWCWAVARRWRNMKQGEGMENESRGWLLSACPFSVRRVSSRVHCVASLFPGREENMRGCVWAHEWAPALHGMLGVRAVKQRERRNKETKQNFQRRLVPWASAYLSVYVLFQHSQHTQSSSPALWPLLHPLLPGQFCSEDGRYHHRPFQPLRYHHFLVTLPCLLYNTHPVVQSSRVHYVTRWLIFSMQS